MAEIRFYHLLTRSFELAVPALLSKAVTSGKKVLIRLGSDDGVQKMDEHLWTYSEDSFLPHAADGADHSELQPIYITSGTENPNRADMIVLCQEDDALPNLEGFTLCCDFIDGQNEDSVLAGRARWKYYKAQGHAVTYWQQTETGGWDQKA